MARLFDYLYRFFGNQKKSKHDWNTDLTEKTDLNGAFKKNRVILYNPLNLCSNHVRLKFVYFMSFASLLNLHCKNYKKKSPADFTDSADYKISLLTFIFISNLRD
jgi:hypothetical protein